MTTDPRHLLDELRMQRPLQEFDSIDHALARSIGAAIAEIAADEHLTITVSVHLGEQLVFHAAMPGTTAAHDGWVRRKRRTAMLHDTPSLEVSLSHEISGRAPSWLDPREFAIAGGAIPLRVKGSTVGVLAVSGLLSSARADHDLAMRGIAAARRLVLGDSGSDVDRS